MVAPLNKCLILIKKAFKSFFFWGRCLNHLINIFFSDKPSKPNIQGNLNILVGNSLELTCTSSSSTTPEYYARLHPLSPLSYTWYVNNTQLCGETDKTLRLRVTRNHKYNQYSCTARDKLESDRSDPVKINPMCKLHLSCLKVMQREITLS